MKRRISSFIAAKRSSSSILGQWAAEFLILAGELARLIRSGDFSEDAVVEFASEQGIAPGIVVGQLQKREHLPYRQLNNLKQRFVWEE